MNLMLLCVWIMSASIVLHAADGVQLQKNAITPLILFSKRMHTVDFTPNKDGMFGVTEGTNHIQVYDVVTRQCIVNKPFQDIKSIRYNDPDELVVCDHGSVTQIIRGNYRDRRTIDHHISVSLLNLLTGVSTVLYQKKQCHPNIPAFANRSKSKDKLLVVCDNEINIFDAYSSSVSHNIAPRLSDNDRFWKADYINNDAAILMASGAAVWLYDVGTHEHKCIFACGGWPRLEQMKSVAYDKQKLLTCTNQRTLLYDLSSKEQTSIANRDDDNEISKAMFHPTQESIILLKDEDDVGEFIEQRDFKGKLTIKMPQRFVGIDHPTVCLNDEGDKLLLCDYWNEEIILCDLKTQQMHQVHKNTVCILKMMFAKDMMYIVTKAGLFAIPVDAKKETSCDLD